MTTCPSALSESLTLEWLSRAVDNRSPKMTYIGLWPEFDLLRDDPRFQALLEKYDQR